MSERDTSTRKNEQNPRQGDDASERGPGLEASWQDHRPMVAVTLFGPRLKAGAAKSCPSFASTWMLHLYVSYWIRVGGGPDIWSPHHPCVTAR